MEDNQSAETKRWIEEQNAVTNEYLEKIPFREEIFNQLKNLYNYERITLPEVRDRKYFYLKNSGLEELNSIYIKDIATDKEELLLSSSSLSDDNTKAIADYMPSGDGSIVAFTVSKAGADWKTIRFIDVHSRQLLKDKLDHVKFSNLTWHNDGLFYSKFDKPEKGNELTEINTVSTLLYHKLGSNVSDDKVVFKSSKGETRFYRTKVVGDITKYLVINEMESSHGSQLYVKNLAQLEGGAYNLTTGFNYSYEVICSVKDVLYILTNYQAPRYRVVKVDLNVKAVGQWEELIPQNEKTLVECEYAGGKLVTLYLNELSNELMVYNLNGDYQYTANLPGKGTIGGANKINNKEEVLFSFFSYVTPDIIYDYNLNTNSLEKIYEIKVDVDFNQFESKLEYCTSKDGTKVPMYIIQKKGIDKNGKAPTILYGYGGFNVTNMPEYDPGIISWVMNGGIYVNAHIRGGGEFGEVWHDEGVKLKKQNVFDDFIACAEYLISENYTNPGKLAIHGGSNGGLLVGAVANQKPELFDAAVPAFGVMDMLRYHKFTIGWAWADEYGTSEDSVNFNNLYSYSPLHNISGEADYPAILVTTADHDDRVVPAHSFKYIATLQDKYKGGKSSYDSNTVIGRSWSKHSAFA